MKKLNRNLLASASLAFVLAGGAYASNQDIDGQGGLSQATTNVSGDEAEQNWVKVDSANDQSKVAVLVVEQVQPVAAPFVKEPQTAIGWFASKIVGKAAVCYVGEKVLGRDYTPVKEVTKDEARESCEMLVKSLGGNFNAIPAEEQVSLVSAYQLGIGNFYRYYESLQVREDRNPVAHLSERTKARKAEREERQRSSSSEDQESN